MKLLTIGNPKTQKSLAYGYLTGVLHLAPHNTAGKTVCPNATIANCHHACLNTAGRGGIAKGSATLITSTGVTVPDNAIQAARIRRTKLFHNDKPEFIRQLAADITKAQRLADKMGVKLAIRLNGTSDIPWETAAPELFETFANVQFYDYTKIPQRLNKPLPVNYHLTLSYSEATDKYCNLIRHAAIEHNNPIAVVFRDELPNTFIGRIVLDGDEHDMRFLDPNTVVIGLKAKGRAKHDISGFVV